MTDMRTDVIRSSHQQRVDDFMRFAEQELPGAPTLPAEAVRRLRASLILEEALETVEALGFSVIPDPASAGEEIKMGGLTMRADKEPNLEQIADGCADLSVVTTGTLSACGIADEGLLDLVDQNNLDKFRLPGGWRRSDGKWMKPPGHKPPRIDVLLAAQTESARVNL